MSSESTAGSSDCRRIELPSVLGMPDSTLDPNSHFLVVEKWSKAEHGIDVQSPELLLDVARVRVAPEQSPIPALWLASEAPGNGEPTSACTA